MRLELIHVGANHHKGQGLPDSHAKQTAFAQTNAKFTINMTSNAQDVGTNAAILH